MKRIIQPTEVGQIIIVYGSLGSNALWWIESKITDYAFRGRCVIGGNGFCVGAACHWGPSATDVIGHSDTLPDADQCRAICALSHGVTFR